MFSSNGPKYNLEFTINELINIPQVSGSCYIDLQIRNSKKPKPSILKHLPNKSKPEDYSSNGTVSKLISTNSSSTSSKIAVSTSRKKIHNFKCTFNFKITCNLKFSLKKSENTIGSKYAIMIVYFVSDTGDSNNIHRNTTELGRTEIDLSNYLNLDEPITSKHLLRQSKVNSILNISMILKELPIDFDFHTQLQISDSPSTNSTSSNHKNIESKTNSNHSKVKSFELPPYERKKLFGKFDEALATVSSSGSENLDNSSSSSYSNNSNDKSNSKANPKQEIHKKNRFPQRSLPDSKFPGSKHYYQQPQQNIIMNPTVSTLYKKLLESTWEPDLHSLLKYTPEQCIDDIFNDKEKVDTWRERASENYNFWESKNDYEEGEVRDVNGLVNETIYRDDLKSWKINTES